jgi:hypothetical protein
MSCLAKDPAERPKPLGSCRAGSRRWMERARGPKTMPAPGGPSTSRCNRSVTFVADLEGNPPDHVYPLDLSGRFGCPRVCPNLEVGGHETHPHGIAHQADHLVHP